MDKEAATHEGPAGFGNNLPHHAVVDNTYAGVKLRDPVKVKSLNYFDEEVPGVDGV